MAHSICIYYLTISYVFLRSPRGYLQVHSIILVFSLLTWTYFTHCSCVSIFDFVQINVTRKFDVVWGLIFALVVLQMKNNKRGDYFYAKMVDSWKTLFKFDWAQYSSASILYAFDEYVTKTFKCNVLVYCNWRNLNLIFRILKWKEQWSEC